MSVRESTATQGLHVCSVISGSTCLIGVGWLAGSDLRRYEVKSNTVLRERREAFAFLKSRRKAIEEQLSETPGRQTEEEETMGKGERRGECYKM